MKNNPFEVHGITHLSPSSINQFISSPAQWVLKVSGHRGLSNPAMWRGTCVDDAVSAAFNYEDKGMIEKTTKNAMSIFYNLYQQNKKTNQYDIAKVEAERKNIQRYVEVAIPFYKAIGKPTAIQKKIELQFEEIPVPIIGYIDLQYEGIIRDIKTTGRLLKVIPLSICRQLSVYGYAENSIPYADFIYVTKDKAEVVSMEITNVESRINEVKKAAISMMNVLSYSDDITQVASLFYPDFDDWRWSDLDIEAAKILWRI